MSRISGDQWIMPNGSFLTTAPGDKPNPYAQLFNGYDYTEQCWVKNGEKIDKFSTRKKQTKPEK